MGKMIKRFYDVGGGKVVGPNGKLVLILNVSELLASESAQAMESILKALEETFPPSFTTKEPDNGENRHH